MSTGKPRVAIFDFACCEGCQLQFVNLEEEILDLIDGKHESYPGWPPNQSSRRTAFGGR